MLALSMMNPSFSPQDIDGKDTPLSKYQGKVCLVVNLASECGPCSV